MEVSKQITSNFTYIIGRMWFHWFYIYDNCFFLIEVHNQLNKSYHILYKETISNFKPTAAHQIIPVSWICDFLSWF